LALRCSATAVNTDPSEILMPESSKFMFDLMTLLARKPPATNLQVKAVIEQ